MVVKITSQCYMLSYRQVARILETQGNLDEIRISGINRFLLFFRKTSTDVQAQEGRASLDKDLEF